jgi:hypothetical protein
MAGLTYDAKTDSYTCPIYGDIGDNTAWVPCYAFCDDGIVDDYEDDPINCDPGDCSICQECLGKGGWVVCGECNINNPDAEF